MSVESRDSFDLRMEHELRSHVATYSGQSPLPAQALYHAWNRQNGLRVSVFAKAAAVAVSTKAAVALAVFAAAVGVTGAGEAAITGSINPADWGQRLVHQIESCSVELTSGSSGAGACASSFVRSAPAQAPTEQDLTGGRSGQPATNHGGGQPEAHPGNGPPATHPGNGPPAIHPGNKPPATHPGNRPPNSKPPKPKPSPTPGGKKPKIHVVGGPFGSAGPPTRHRL
jgi:hypothetical protein